MLKTEYLFGKHKDSYQPHLTLVASRRIVDAQILMKKLSKQKETTDDVEALIERYQAVAKAKKFWEEILAEE